MRFEVSEKLSSWNFIEKINIGDICYGLTLFLTDHIKSLNGRQIEFMELYVKEVMSGF